jgi:hypothetical protein
LALARNVAADWYRHRTEKRMAREMIPAFAPRRPKAKAQLAALYCCASVPEKVDLLSTLNVRFSEAERPHLFASCLRKTIGR